MSKRKIDEKRTQRHSETQEDFTPSHIVELLLSGLDKEDFSDHDKTFLDNSCGIGNILLGILNKRFDYCQTLIEVKRVLLSTYGMDIMADNVEECRQNIFDLSVKRFPEIVDDVEVQNEIKFIIKNRIIWYDFLKFDFDSYNSELIFPKRYTKNLISFSIEDDGTNPDFPMWKEKSLCAKLW